MKLSISQPIKHLYSFLLGMVEFRSLSTTNPGEEFMESYERGRELAHRLTLRRWD